MAVGLGVAGSLAAGTLVDATAATSITTGSFTVGGIVSALLGVVTIGAVSGETAATGVSCSWNGAGMTQVVGPVTITSSTFIVSGATYFFSLPNPTFGTGTATVSWTNACRACFNLISFTGTDPTTPFVNPASNTGTGGTASCTITVPVNGGAVAMGLDCANWVTSASMTGTGVTPWFADQSTIQTVAAYGFGSSNLTFNATDSGSPAGNWSIAGIGINPAPPQGPPVILQGSKRLRFT